MKCSIQEHYKLNSNKNNCNNYNYYALRITNESLMSAFAPQTILVKGNSTDSDGQTILVKGINLEKSEKTMRHIITMSTNKQIYLLIQLQQEAY